MIKFFRKRMNKKGFTLVELLIVIAVLGIIAGIAVPSMSGVTDTFKRKADIETARIAARQVEVMTMAGFWADGTVVAATETVVSADFYGDALPTSQLEDGASMVITLGAGAVNADRTLTITNGTDSILTETISGLIE